MSTAMIRDTVEKNRYEPDRLVGDVVCQLLLGNNVSG